MATNPYTGNGSSRGCLANLLLAVVIIFIPIVGHIVLTVMILDDDISGAAKIGWLVVVWLLWFVGPFLYLLIGQKRDRVFGAIR
ncbi:MAG: PLDc N-terminal domain-containing protein [Ktedonobacterales bacterium]|nr:PLDc N-terminal domain-containing protein [Ktedonobacterales bacterium]